MNPPFSVIFLTTLSGLGQGLFLALMATQIRAALMPALPAPATWFYVTGSALVLLLEALGLLASFFHLGHPERAWRALAKLRTSWLSRECLALPLFMLSVFTYGSAWWLKASPTTLLWLGILGVILCASLFICTSMIYACLRFLQEWHSPFTLINFTALGSASGFLLATAMAAWFNPSLINFYGKIALSLTIVSACTRGLSLCRNKRLRPKSTLQSALGIQHPKLKQKSQGAMGGSYNTREFFHGKTRFFIRSIKWWFITFAFIIPIASLFWQLMQPNLIIITSLVFIQYLGLLAERWYFFADAKHPQNLYYQVIS